MDSSDLDEQYYQLSTNKDYARWIMSKRVESKRLTHQVKRCE